MTLFAASASSTAFAVNDVIDHGAGIRPGDALDTLRAQRPQARLQAQQSHRALFEPAPPASADAARFTKAERFAIAFFVVGLHGASDLLAFYAAGLLQAGAPTALIDAVAAEAAAGAARGPYGRYPAGPLSTEDVPGPIYGVNEACRVAVGARLAAALAHAHLLVLHPRDAEAASLQSLLDAGWSTTEIVTLSQLIAFLTFQIRVVAGLRALAARPATAAA